MPLPEDQIEQLFEGIYVGSINLFELPRFLYIYTALNLDRSLFAGFGKIGEDETKAARKAYDFRLNLGRFSGAKTFQEVRALTNFVFDENGFKRPFSEFKQLALSINKQYNITWLRTEQESVVLQSINGKRWIKFEEEKDIFPVLEYRTIGDDRVRPDHAALHGLRLPVDNPLWRRIMPQNGWRCRCTVIQHESTRVTPHFEAIRKIELIEKEFKKNATFAYNAGLENFIFREKGKGRHEYFKAPKGFRADFAGNFGFPIIENLTGTQL